MSEKSGPDYYWLVHEVKRLRDENESLRKERDRIWDEATHALQVERKLRDLLQSLTTLERMSTSG